MTGTSCSHLVTPPHIWGKALCHVLSRVYYHCNLTIFCVTINLIFIYSPRLKVPWNPRPNFFSSPCSQHREQGLYIAHKSESENESLSVVSDSLQPHGLYSPWNSVVQNTRVGSLSLLRGVFPAQRLNPSLLYCRLILYQLSHKGSPRILEWVDYPFSRGSFQGIFPTHESNQGLLHCRQIFYQLNYQGNPKPLSNPLFVV